VLRSAATASLGLTLGAQELLAADGASSALPLITRRVPLIDAAYRCVR
jgi:hypothetical protein